jgi:stage III sporulation protein AG
MNLDWWRNLLQHDRSKLVRIGVMAALGLALLVVGSMHPRTSPAKAPPKSSPGPLVTEQAEVESQLATILRAIPGAGSMRVAVTLSRTTQSQYVTSSSSLEGGTSPLLVDNNSGQTVVPLDEVGPSVQGVVVVARSAANPVVRSELAQAVETLLQIPAYQVLILPS